MTILDQLCELKPDSNCFTSRSPMSAELTINEIYLSLQGESTFAGLALRFYPADGLQFALLLLRHRLCLHPRAAK